MKKRKERDTVKLLFNEIVTPTVARKFTKKRYIHACAQMFVWLLTKDINTDNE